MQIRQVVLVCIGLLMVAFGLSLIPAKADGPNLIANPSVETPTSGSPTIPNKWLKNKWSTNNAFFTYQKTGQSGSRSLSVKVANYVNGDIYSVIPANLEQQLTEPKAKALPVVTVNNAIDEIKLQ